MIMAGTNSPTLLLEMIALDNLSISQTRLFELGRVLSITGNSYARISAFFGYYQRDLIYIYTHKKIFGSRTQAT